MKKKMSSPLLDLFAEFKVRGGRKTQHAIVVTTQTVSERLADSPTFQKLQTKVRGAGAGAWRTHTHMCVCVCVCVCVC